ncbi:2-oxoglutarate dehydrogenase complex dihydrolipoyllysine-residue succinyltransferase [Stieleria sp. ICT_E10.1]|uniref:2-oxoglutarate dehydrogenase complex dihydrolipoyllysine-residue succinyltransferase n=1 Tax=Stieleria sedimenti TaxID=2976331 RepID=UPI0021808AD4|nr:2-oxoglutarate dehydrogenase complex dihydrolipoyllysine-residue succinyltransferase [Stieleria sedimenti]MCS7465557.1 2-oxoglutarate dehydrogenase complex dihydrolipoyllysine-residue succinyltransferase [Stieleria sedimenti]
MSEIVDVEVPTVGESITEVQLGAWIKSEGEWVESGEDLVEIETEKASVQLPAPAAGFLEGISKQEGDFAEIGELIAKIRVAPKPDSDASASPGSGSATASADSTGGSGSGAAGSGGSAASFVMPAAQRLLDENGLSASDVPASGPGGRLLKEDVQRYLESAGSKQASKPAEAPPAEKSPGKPAASTAVTAPSKPTSTLMTGAPDRSEEVKPLSMLRRTIASRLVNAQQTAALLTTFNEIDMQPVMSLRKKYKDAFLEKHGVKLGFMSFFAKAAVEALRRFPAVNAEIREDSAIYRNYQDIGVAIGGGKGLVVPIIRNTERLSFAEIEWTIADFAKQATENRLQAEDLIGGTFTISNGGVYGSLLSTPIVNPPQSGILGLHSIQDRPVAIEGKVEIRPMMYVALTYDHRIVDGREAVGFLITIKEVIEDPARLFLEL